MSERPLVYFVGATLDGYIAGPGGEIDFFPLADDVLAFLVRDYPETIPTHLRPRLGIDPAAPNRRFDTVVMGRRTYEPALDLGITSPYAHLRQHVVSTTMPSIEDPDVELVRRDPVGLVRRLKREPGRAIWLAGGGALAASVLREIDELTIKRYPIVAGAGVRMIAGTLDPTGFRLAQTLHFDDGTLVSTYRREGGPRRDGSTESGAGTTP